MLYLKLQRLQFIQLTTPFNTNQLCENTSIYYRPKITTLRDNGTTPRDNGNMEYNLINGIQPRYNGNMEYDLIKTIKIIYQKMGTDHLF